MRSIFYVMLTALMTVPALAGCDSSSPTHRRLSTLVGPGWIGIDVGSIGSAFGHRTGTPGDKVSWMNINNQTPKQFPYSTVLVEVWADNPQAKFRKLALWRDGQVISIAMTTAALQGHVTANMPTLNQAVEPGEEHHLEISLDTQDITSGMPPGLETFLHINVVEVIRVGGAAIRLSSPLKIKYRS